MADERNPDVLADMGQALCLRANIPELSEALTEHFNAHDAFLVKVHLNLIDEHTRALDEITAQIEEEMIPFRTAGDLHQSR